MQLVTATPANDTTVFSQQTRIFDTRGTWAVVPRGCPGPSLGLQGAWGVGLEGRRGWAWEEHGSPWAGAWGGGGWGEGRGVGGGLGQREPNLVPGTRPRAPPPGSGGQSHRCPVFLLNDATPQTPPPCRFQIVSNDGVLFPATWKYARGGYFLERGAEHVCGQTRKIEPSPTPDGRPHPPRIGRARGPRSTGARRHPQGLFLLHVWVTL